MAKKKLPNDLNDPFPGMLPVKNKKAKAGDFHVECETTDERKFVRGPWRSLKVATKHATKLLWTGNVEHVWIVETVLAHKHHASWKRG